MAPRHTGMEGTGVANKPTDPDRLLQSVSLGLMSDVLSEWHHYYLVAGAIRHVSFATLTLLPCIPRHSFELTQTVTHYISLAETGLTTVAHDTARLGSGAPRHR